MSVPYVPVCTRTCPIRSLFVPRNMRYYLIQIYEKCPWIYWISSPLCHCLGRVWPNDFAGRTFPIPVLEELDTTLCLNVAHVRNMLYSVFFFFKSLEYSLIMKSSLAPNDIHTRCPGYYAHVVYFRFSELGVYRWWRVIVFQRLLELAFTRVWCGNPPAPTRFQSGVGYRVGLGNKS